MELYFRLVRCKFGGFVRKRIFSYTILGQPTQTVVLNMEIKIKADYIFSLPVHSTKSYVTNYIIKVFSFQETENHFITYDTIFKRTFSGFFSLFFSFFFFRFPYLFVQTVNIFNDCEHLMYMFIRYL